jgi:hypothetical protein
MLCKFVVCEKVLWEILRINARWIIRPVFFMRYVWHRCEIKFLLRLQKRGCTNFFSKVQLLATYHIFLCKHRWSARGQNYKPVFVASMLFWFNCVCFLLYGVVWKTKGTYTAIPWNKFQRTYEVEFHHEELHVGNQNMFCRFEEFFWTEECNFQKQL